MASIRFGTTNYYFFYELPTGVDEYGNSGVFYTGDFIKLDQVIPQRGQSNTAGPGGYAYYGTQTASFVYSQQVTGDARTPLASRITYYNNVENISDPKFSLLILL
jgi:hypothetical protein